MLKFCFISYIFFHIILKFSLFLIFSAYMSSTLQFQLHSQMYIFHLLWPPVSLTSSPLSEQSSWHYLCSHVPSQSELFSEQSSNFP